jgi:hypothetical protein
MPVQLTQNRKMLSGSSIILTSDAFMLAVYGTLVRIPGAIVTVHLIALAVGTRLLWAGSREESRRIAQAKSEAETNGTV